MKKQTDIKVLSEIVISSIFMGYLFALFIRHFFAVIDGEWYLIVLRYILIYIGAMVFRLTFYQYLREKKSRLGKFLFFTSTIVSVFYLWYNW
jgi:putative Ca2+/H+ antiporter (TMEM165/GDT1 family)